MLTGLGLCLGGEVGALAQDAHLTWFEVGQSLAETIDELYIVTVHVL